MNSLKINDIKSIVEVDDYSFYILILLVLMATAIVILFIYYLYKKIKNKKINFQKNYIQKLKDINVSESKRAAYSITKYTQLLHKNERQLSLANELILELDKYKYKKETGSFDENTLNLYKKLLETL